MTRFILIIAILQLAVATLWADQKGIIVGYVNDSETFQGLPGALVMIPGLGLGASSGADGYFIILNVPADTSLELASGLIGYDKLSPIKIKVPANDTLRIIISMKVTQLDTPRPGWCYAGNYFRRSGIDKEILTRLTDHPLDQLLGYYTGNINDIALGGHPGETEYIFFDLPFFDPFVRTPFPDIPMTSLNGLYLKERARNFRNRRSHTAYGVNPNNSSRNFIRFSGSGAGLIEELINPNIASDLGVNYHHPVGHIDFLLNQRFGVMRTSLVISGELKRDQGRWKNDFENSEKILAYLQFSPTRYHRIDFISHLSHRDIGKYDKRYANQTSETEDLDEDGKLDMAFVNLSSDPYHKAWTILDFDGDGDNIHEDLNWNLILDETDFNRDGDLNDSIDLLSALATKSSWDYGLALKWHWSLSSRMYMRTTLSTYSHTSRLNVDETVNEDINGNQVLDPGEDYNGNGALDPSTWDLLTDEDEDGIIDASQYSDWNPEEQIESWGTKTKAHEKTWGDVKLGNNERGYGGIKFFGDGLNFDPHRWATTSKRTYSATWDYGASLHKNHATTLGGEAHVMDVFYNFVWLSESGAKIWHQYGEQKGRGDSLAVPVRPYRIGAYLQHDLSHSLFNHKRVDVSFALRFQEYNTDYDKLVTLPFYYQLAPDDPYADYEKQRVWSPQFDLKMNITDCLQIVGGYGKYYHSPREVLQLTQLIELGFKYAYKNIQSEVRFFHRESPEEKDFSSDHRNPIFHQIYENVHSSSARGVKYQLVKPRGRYLQLLLNYTYSSSQFVTGEDFSFGYCATCPPDSNEYTYFEPWDQRHTLSMVADLRHPNQEIGMILLGRYGSGFPYTAKHEDYPVYDVYENRLPASANLDIHLYKEFRLKRRFRWKPIRFTDGTLFLDVKNVFNRRDIVGLYDAEWFQRHTMIQEAFEAGDVAFLGGEDQTINGIDDDGDGYIDETIRDEYMILMDTNADGVVDWSKRNPAGGQPGHPQYYSEPRVWRIGVKFSL
ncbi:MAG: carboxypeptidase-like regulatory domain-containing protein [Candidatus Marinimicrobia bacterium]|nr:carboxypeptidase-like regulatory domain-containing protein [Candidatus Neomarinimicrobiota bacterium]